MSNNPRNPYRISWRLIYGIIIVSSKNIDFKQGYIRVIRCDNGANFVGANNDLNLCIKKSYQAKLQNFSKFSEDRTDFQPSCESLVGRDRGILSQISHMY